MAAFAWQDKRSFTPQEFSWERMQIAVVNRSAVTGSPQVGSETGSCWLVNLTFPFAHHRDRAELDVFLTTVGGAANRIDIWNFLRPVPAGTMRGAPTLASGAVQFASQFTIQTTPGATLLPNDLFGVGWQVFKVYQQATANGAGLMVVTTVNRTRVPLTSGTAVTWDRPKIRTIPTSSLAVPYRPGGSPPFSISLEEDTSIS